MRHTVLIVLTSFVVLAGAASARQAPQLTPEQRQAVLAYSLTLPKADHLIAALDEMTKYVVSLPDFRDRMIKAMGMSPADRKAQIEKDPQAMAILKKHSLTTDDYIVGVPALRMALMAAQGANGPTITASPANVSFAKANLAALKPKMDAADGMRGKPQD